ncbi:MAG: metal ABC transporter solute-binding protein, Zn/Mn family, partial [Vulcanococcus sp.]
MARVVPNVQDPHVWHDPRQSAAMAVLISSTLQELAPEAAPQIQRRQRAVDEALLALDRW